MSKSRKSLPTWQQCDKCQSSLMQKDLSLHELNCPPSTENWQYSFIKDGILYSTVEAFELQELPIYISEKESTDIVFISEFAFQLCNIAIGDQVAVTTKDITVVKTAFPLNDKSLMNVSLTKCASALHNLTGAVKISSLYSNVCIAKEIIIRQLGKHPIPVTTELKIVLRNYCEHKIFAIGNQIRVPFYGKKISFKIVQVKADKNEDARTGTDSNLSGALEKLNLTTDSTKNAFYKVFYNTKWTILTKDEEDIVPCKKTWKIEDIGGYDALISDIKEAVATAIGEYESLEYFNVNRGVLLYGPAGVGKSMIANAIMSEINVKTYTVYSSDIYNKFLGETENKLKEIFNKAISRAPSIILLEDIDSLCPKQRSSSMNHEGQVLAQLIKLFDNLHSTNSNVLVMATTARLDSVDASLRKHGRFNREFEIYVPTPNMRMKILTKFFSKIPNTLTDENMRSISFVTHGFVGADLNELCCTAIINAKRKQKNGITPIAELQITMADFDHALTVTKPSAMKEDLIEVPNVKWSDIGGQRDLKLKLEQAIEWPLRHPEAFARMGITPHKGILMYGPPGCSKTMIAKALATESKVNFLNIKGPELFSKWVGESEKAVREVFRKARQVAPSIVFIDEIDALGGERASSSGSSGSNVQERVLAQLLTELDGITSLEGVTLVAATNRPDKIDKALLRPGRLDCIIHVDLPDEDTRREIFDIKLRNMPVTEQVKIADLVSLTEGYTGAEIEAICREAAIQALEKDIDAIVVTQEHFKVALAIVTPRTPVSLMKIYEDYAKKHENAEVTRIFIN